MMVLDVECLPNYFLIGFKSPETGRTMQFEAYGEHSRLTERDIHTINLVMDMNTTFGYNSNKYDIPMIYYALQGVTCLELHNASVGMISGGETPWNMMRRLNINLPMFLDHFDVCEPSPAVMISLKAYGTRMGSKKLQEFFVDPMLPLDPSVIPEMRSYNINDLDTTIDLYNAIKDRIELRVQMSEQYGIDLRSKSDAQIAEAVIVSELFKQGIRAIVPQLPPTYTAHYKAPSYISFNTVQLQDILKEVQAIEFELATNGALKMPEVLSKKTIKIGKTVYKLGIGGLHSQEKCLVAESNETHVMRNADFEAFYPWMIIRNKLAPTHLGYGFLTVYQSIVELRMKAKKEKNKLVDKSLKIVINGSFGKFGSKYSKLFSPDLLLATTITGQLTLLMIIEQFEAHGISVVSANTDGLEYFCPRDKIELAEDLIAYIEFLSGLKMEHGSYLGLYARDVNNYIAKYDGKVKAKGVYADPFNDAEHFLKKGLETRIVFEAIRKYIELGTPLESTIYSCTVVNDFLSSRTVKGGAVWGHDGSPISDLPEFIQATKITKALTLRNDKHRASQLKGHYLGKMVRWYYSTQGEPIYYRTNGNQVPKTGDGVAPMMDLSDTLPHDLNWQWYVDEAVEMLKDLGVTYART
jgi:hypothetical protein